MEKIQKLIKLCKRHEVFVEELNTLSNNHFRFKKLPFQIIKIKLEEDYTADFEFTIDTGKLKMMSWWVDHHSGSHHDYKEVEISLSEEEQQMFITHFEKSLEYLLKVKLKEEIIKEMVNDRYDLYMARIN
jgi:hypothetical protein